MHNGARTFNLLDAFNGRTAFKLVQQLCCTTCPADTKQHVIPDGQKSVGWVAYCLHAGKRLLSSNTARSSTTVKQMGQVDHMLLSAGCMCQCKQV
jgi:hypothetical protein